MSPLVFYSVIPKCDSPFSNIVVFYINEDFLYENNEAKQSRDNYGFLFVYTETAEALR